MAHKELYGGVVRVTGFIMSLRLALVSVCVQPGTQKVVPSGNVGSGFYHGGSGEKGCCLGSGARAVKYEVGSELL